MELLAGVELRKRTIHRDNRGSFSESWIKADDGLTGWYRQLNTAVSHQNVFRGMHRSGQRKLIMPVSGIIIDYVLNPETGSWCSVQLDSTVALYVPEEYAHGYYAITDCVVQYIVDKPWDKSSEEQFNYIKYGIKIPSTHPILSAKDQN